MAWKAECNRRKWYCILGWDAVSWFLNTVITNGAGR